MKTEVTAIHVQEHEAALIRKLLDRSSSKKTKKDKKGKHK